MRILFQLNVNANFNRKWMDMKVKHSQCHKPYKKEQIYKCRVYTVIHKYKHQLGHE